MLFHDGLNAWDSVAINLITIHQIFMKINHFKYKLTYLTNHPKHAKARTHG
jgi:hypothetical protein